MNKHLAILCPRTVDPITNQFELGFKSVDTVVADTFDAKVLDMILTLFDPKSAVTTRSLTGNELTRRRHVVDVGVLSRGGGMKRWRNESALADGDDVRDTESVKHERIRGVVPKQRAYN